MNCCRSCSLMRAAFIIFINYLLISRFCHCLWGIVWKLIYRNISKNWLLILLGVCLRSARRIAEERWTKFVHSFHSKLLSTDSHYDFILVNINLRKDYVLNKIYQLVGLLKILRSWLIFTIINVAQRMRVSLINQTLQPCVEDVSIMDFINPELNEIKVVQVEDGLLVWSFNLEIIIISLLIPWGLLN